MASVCCGLLFEYRDDDRGSKVEKIEEEVGGVIDVDLEGVGTVGWEVLHVERDDGGGIRSNGRGQYVAVLWVAGHRVDQGTVTGDLGVRETAGHLGGEVIDSIRCDPQADEVA